MRRWFGRPARQGRKRFQGRPWISARAKCMIAAEDHQRAADIANVLCEMLLLNLGQFRCRHVIQDDYGRSKIRQAIHGQIAGIYGAPIL